MSRLGEKRPKFMLDTNSEDSSQDPRNSSQDHDQTQNSLHVIDTVLKRLGLEMKDNFESAIRCVDRCKWMIISPSCLLMTLFSWDVVGDQDRWDGSYWIPFLGVIILLTIWLLDKCLIRMRSCKFL